ncbi:hypothetical protein CKAH01_01918 [Colletotrichum kahawae]|uniref:Uncharacterized protein n=1 Tax=Colletotrichum kahawae TaxID=34407 RepID=A0AAE0D1C5_COLKA|nr:hypothetical protein CKAH01_01918 [Colletotrichum kahawae]
MEHAVPKRGISRVCPWRDNHTPACSISVQRSKENRRPSLFLVQAEIRASDLEVTGYGCSEVPEPSKFPMAPHMCTSNWIRTMNLSGTRMSRYRHAMGVEIADEEEGDDGDWGPGGWGTTGDRRADERKDGRGKLGLAAVEGTD